MITIAVRCSDEVTHLEQLDALVERRDDLGLRDAEPRARRDVDLGGEESTLLYSLSYNPPYNPPHNKRT